MQFVCFFKNMKRCPISRNKDFHCRELNKYCITNVIVARSLWACNRHENLTWLSRFFYLKRTKWLSAPVYRRIGQEVGAYYIRVYFKLFSFNLNKYISYLIMLIYHFFSTPSLPQGGPGSAVGIATAQRAGRSGDRIPVVARFSTPVQTGPGAHPASCTMGTGSFPGVKSADRSPPSSAVVMKE